MTARYADGHPARHVARGDGGRPRVQRIVGPHREMLDLDAGSSEEFNSAPDAQHGHLFRELFESCERTEAAVGIDLDEPRILELGEVKSRDVV